MLWKLALSILTGVLSGAAFTAPSRANLIWLALVPLVYVLEHEQTKRMSFFYGLIAGLAHALLSVFWIHHIGWIALPFLALYVAIFWAAFSVFSKWILGYKYDFIVISVFWVILEWIRLSFGFFGWNLFAYALAERLYLIQISDIFGPWAMSFLVVWANLAIYGLIFKARQKAVRNFFVLLVVLLISYVYGYATVKSTKLQSEQREQISVEVIQANASREDKSTIKGQVRLYENLKLLLASTENKSLMVSPEATWPQVMLYPDFNDISLFLKKYDRPVFMGVVEERESGEFNNSMLYYDQDSKFIDRYAKIKLVPFGEFVPLRKYLAFIEALNNLGDMQAGEKKTIFEYRGVKFASLICFEDIFTEMAAAFVREGAEFLVNATDDSWFYGNPQVYQHMLVARYRAVENKRPLIRAANSGISCLIEPWGEVNQVLEDEGQSIGVSGIKEIKLRPLDRLTFYSRFPKIFISLIFILLGVCIINQKKDKNGT